jgi:hypothetical protein
MSLKVLDAKMWIVRQSWIILFVLRRSPCTGHGGNELKAGGLYQGTILSKRDAQFGRGPIPQLSSEITCTCQRNTA